MTNSGLITPANNTYRLGGSSGILVITNDGALSSHFEHMVLVTEGEHAREVEAQRVVVQPGVSNRQVLEAYLGN